MTFALPRRLAAEFIGTAVLLATVVGSGIMGENLAGGTAANTAIVYAQLHGGCALAGVVGDDPMGDFIETAMGARGVRLLGPRGGATATHTIVLGRDGRRQAYYFAGTWLDLRAIHATWSGGNLYLSGINLCLRRPLVDVACELAASGRSTRHATSPLAPSTARRKEPVRWSHTSRTLSSNTTGEAPMP